LVASVTTSSDDGREGAGGDKPAGKPASPDFMPSPPVAAAAVMVMLAFGVFLGSATNQLAQSAGMHSILVEVSPPSAPEPPAERPATAPVAELEPEPPPPPATPSLPVAPIPLAEPAPKAPPPPTLPAELPEEEVLPPVKHVFLIVLAENSFEEAFGETAPAPYLAQTLREKGELIPNYYAVTQGDLANQIALLSGQGPTPETVSECPAYADLAPGTLSPEGQVEGSGCIYPGSTMTLPGQLAERKLRAKAYVEGLVEACVHEDGRRNPFVYFRSLLDAPDCAKDDVSLDRLSIDLETASRTPELSYIVPNPCRNGEPPCAEGQLTGPLAAEEFLQRIVPAIEASPAYGEGGLIAITSTQAPQTGVEADTSACCISPAYPNLPPSPAAEPSSGPVKAAGGGGKVGLLLISPFVEPASSEEAGYFNHYSLLLTIEELFGLEKLGYANEPALVPFGETVFNTGDDQSLDG